MAKYVYAADDMSVPVCKLISIEEEGVVVRYTSPASAALIVAFVFKGRRRHSYRRLTVAETATYWAAKASHEAGANI